MRDGISSRASCLACNAVAGLFLSSIYSKEMMTVAVNTVCTSFRLQSPRVCNGIVESFKVKSIMDKSKVKDKGYCNAMMMMMLFRIRKPDF